MLSIYYTVQGAKVLFDLLQDVRAKIELFQSKIAEFVALAWGVIYNKA